MAVAARESVASAKTEHRQQVGARARRKHKKRRNTAVARVTTCSVVMLCLLGYVGTYAQVTRCGYHRARLAQQIRQAESENRALRAEIQMLSSPARLTSAAMAAGMSQGAAPQFIRAQETTKVAKAD